MRRFIRISLLSLGLSLALLYPAYLGVGNWLLRGELERRINRRPETLSITWRSAWTSWPGVVHVQGFQIRGQTRSVQWWATVDRGRIDVDLWSLRDREFSAHGIDGEGVAFRLRRRADARPRWRTDPALRPPIPGLANPPRRPPERIYPRRPRRRGRNWRVELAGMDLSGVREIWIEEFRFRGDARAVGGFDLTLRERLEVLPARVELRSGDLLRGRASILAQLSGEVTGALAPFDPLRYRGRQAFRFASGRVAVGGQIGGLGAVEPLLRQARWIDLSGGAGPLAADVRLRRGRFLPGSRLEARPREVTIGFLDYRATGSGRVTWEVVEGKDGPRKTAGKAGDPGPGGGIAGVDRIGRLTTRLESFGIQRQGYPRPHVRGRGLSVVTTTPEPVFERLLFPVSLAIDMPEAEVPDLTFYNAYLPDRAGLSLRSGSGRFSGQFRAASPDWVGSGQLALAARRVVADFRDARLRGDFRVRTRLGRADLKDRVFDVGGSDFELTGVSVVDGTERGEPVQSRPGWWLRGHLDRGRLMPGRPVYLSASAEATMRDPRPLVALFAPEGRVVRWLEDMLAVEGVGATAEVELREDSILIENLAAAGRGAGGRELEIRARLRIREASPRGALYLRWGRLDVGLEVAGAKRDWKVLRPRRWFEERSGLGL